MPYPYTASQLDRGAIADALNSLVERIAKVEDRTPPRQPRPAGPVDQAPNPK